MHQNAAAGTRPDAAAPCLSLAAALVLLLLVINLAHRSHEYIPHHCDELMPSALLDYDGCDVFGCEERGGDDAGKFALADGHASKQRIGRRDGRWQHVSREESIRDSVLKVAMIEKSVTEFDEEAIKARGLILWQR